MADGVDVSEVVTKSIFRFGGATDQYRISSLIIQSDSLNNGNKQSFIIISHH
jgi:hypothetical protein